MFKFKTTRCLKENIVCLQPRWMTELLYPIFQVLGPRENPEWEKNTTEEYFKFENEHHGGRPGQRNNCTFGTSLLALVLIIFYINHVRLLGGGISLLSTRRGHLHQEIYQPN